MTTTTEPDTSKLDKIRALLDKAESTADEFPQEAEALTLKAIELMERYRIDEAMLAESRPTQDRGKIVEKRIRVGSGPYVNARIMLATSIAQNHSVVVLQQTTYEGKTIFLTGYETDVALTELLYTSLLLQATRAMNSPAIRSAKPDSTHGIAFNRAFILGFASRIGERLRVAVDNIASSENGSSVALVLVDRRKDVDDVIARRYGKIRHARPVAAASSLSGEIAGHRAANKADLSTNRRVSDMRAIGR